MLREMPLVSAKDRTLDTHAKALQINLDARRYGTFAEIGAGQEVVRWFFRAGGAAGTIAKSMSAYDMTVSDAIYGKAERYVCRPRLEAMLAHEHDLNLSRLGETRGATTAFFAFADTVAARSYRGTNDCHGWMGVRFQSRPRDQESQIIIHIRLLDSENALQQEALGIVGVNLLYGAFFVFHEPEMLIESLLDGLTTQRISIDVIEFSGIEFRQVDNRLMSMKLVQMGLSGAAMFDPKGAVLQPSEVLYKKNVLVERGSFRPVCHPNIDMLRSARENFALRSRERRRAGRRDRRVDGADHAQPARTGRRDRSGGFPRARRHAGRFGQDRHDLRLLRVLPAGGLSGPAHQKEDCADHGRGQPARAVRREVLRSIWKAEFSNPSGGCSRTTCACTSTRCSIRGPAA